MFSATTNKSELQFADAAAEGDLKACQNFLEAGINVNACNGAGTTALGLAVVHGHTDVVRLLLSKNAYVNVRTREPFGETPLTRAASKGHIDIVKAVIGEWRGC